MVLGLSVMADPNVWASFASTYLAGISYKRDAYSDNVAMRQAQIYQEKNYYITWVVAVREEIRDIMTIFVGRMTNFMVVETLIIGIVAAIVCEGEVHENCPEYIVNAMYLCLAVSAMFLAMSLMFAVKGTVVAYDSSMTFLTQVVPDHLDRYAFDYLQQTTTHFNKEKGNRTWIPGFQAKVPESYKNVEHLNLGACRVVHFDLELHGLDFRSISRTVSGQQCLELLVRRATASVVQANVDVVVAEAIDGGPDRGDVADAITKVHVRSMFYSKEKAMRAKNLLESSNLTNDIRLLIEANEHFLVGRSAVRVVECVRRGDIKVRYETFYAPDDPRRFESKGGSSVSSKSYLTTGLHQRGTASPSIDVEEKGQPHSYFDTLLRYSDLWEPFAYFTQVFMNHGIVALCQGTGYYCLGRLYDMSERWAGLTMLGLFVFLAALIFREGISAKAVHSRSGAPSPILELPRIDYILLVALVLGPTFSALADKGEVAYPWALVLAASSYLSHVFLYAVFLFRLVQQSRGRRGRQGAAGTKTANGDGAQIAGAQIAAAEGAQTAAPQQVGGAMHINERDLEMDRFAPRSGRDPEGLLAEMLDEHRRDIHERNTKGFFPLAASTCVVVMAWITMLVWLLVHHDFHSTCHQDGVRCRMVDMIELKDVPLPSSFFSARGIACGQGSTFVADDFRVYELHDDLQAPHMHPVNCNLTGTVRAVSASCGPSGKCWPLVLMGGSGAPGVEEVINCSAPSSPLRFRQGTQPSDGLLAPIGSSTAITVHSGGSLTEVEWSPSAGTFQPLWSLGQLDIAGGRAIDIVNAGFGDRLVMVFHDAWRNEGFAAVAVHRLRPPHPATLETVWRLPREKVKAVLSGCAINTEAARLLVQGDDGVPTLARVTLATQSGK